MRKHANSALHSTVSETPDAIAYRELSAYLTSWISDGQYRFLTRDSIDNRKNVAKKFEWWVNRQEPKPEYIDKRVVRGFLHYLTVGHEDPEGRWGNPNEKQKIRPGTAKSYYRVLHAFFEFCREEGAIEASPMAELKPPIDRPDQKQPFTKDQIKALIHAAETVSRYGRRNKAIILVFLDTGIRSGELAALRMSDVNLTEGYILIRCGKGQKSRRMNVHPKTRRAITAYLRGQKREPDDPLFQGEGGGALTRSGLRQLIAQLGEYAGIEGIQCSPHIFRHTFSVDFLRNGGNVFTLQQMLGHTTLAMTQQYVAIAQADIAEQHRRHSPVGSLYKGER